MELEDMPSTAHVVINTDESENSLLPQTLVANEYANESDNGYSKYRWLKECLKIKNDDDFKNRIYSILKVNLSDSHRSFIETYVESYENLWTRIIGEDKRSKEILTRTPPENESIASDDELYEGCKLFPFLVDLSEDRIRNGRYMDSPKELFVYNLLVCMNAADTLRLLEFLKGPWEFWHLQRRARIGECLYAVVKNVKCNVEIIKFVIEELHVEPHWQDNNGETALHYFCNNYNNSYPNHKLRNESLKEIIALLSGKDKSVLMKTNRRGITPMQLVCYRKQLYDAMSELLMDSDFFEHVDVRVKGFPDIKKVQITVNAAYDVWFWKEMLSINSRSNLIAYLKDAKCFEQRFYKLEKDKFKEVYFRRFEYSNVCDSEMFVIYEEFCKGNMEISDFLKFPGVGDFHYYRSAPYMALITGRWDLAMPLIAFSRFHVVSYCLLTCAACVKMQQLTYISDNVHLEAKEMHRTADAYLAEFVNVMERKHARRADYNIIQDYLTKRNSFFNGSLMDIGYFSDCKQFFKTSSCQKALTDVWKERRNCLSPFHKFVAHSFTHILFLVLLFSVLLTTGHKGMLHVKIFCYFYGLGYFVEEVRQILYYRRMEQLSKYFRDATNVIDLFGLFSFLVAFILQCSSSYSTDAVHHTEGQIKQSFSMNFYIRLFLCLTAIFLSVRLLYFLSAFKTFGQKLKMIEHMIVIDLLPVSVIFLVFILSFGVAFQSLILSGFSNKTVSIERNSSSTDKGIIAILADILWQPTFTIFEPKYVIEMAEKSESPSIQNPMMNVVVQFLLIMFIIIVSVMLMNMLIALFSKTVTDVGLTANESWAIDRWKLIREYTERSVAPPPVNVIEIVWLLMESCWKRHKGKQTDDEAHQEKADIHPFEILFLLEDRFELLEKREESDLVDNIPKMMNLQRQKMEKLDKLEEMIKLQKDQIELMNKLVNAKGI